MNDESHDNLEAEGSPEPVSTPAEPEVNQHGENGEPGGEAPSPDEAPSEIEQEHASVASGWRPADYYAAPRSTAKFPRWVPLTCGVVAILALVFMVAVGAFLRSGGLAKLVAISFGQLNAEASRMFDDDVDPAARQAFGSSLLALRDAIADGKIELSGALPVLQEMQRATRDGKLSAEEVDALTASFRKSLATPAPKTPPGEPPVVDL